MPIRQANFVTINSKPYLLAADQGASIQQAPKDLVPLNRSDIIPDPRIPGCFWKIYNQFHGDTGDQVFQSVGRSRLTVDVEASIPGILRLGPNTTLSKTWTAQTGDVAGLVEQNSKIFVFEGTKINSIEGTVAEDYDYVAVSTAAAKDAMRWDQDGNIYYCEGTRIFQRTPAGGDSSTVLVTDRLIGGPTGMWRAYTSSNVAYVSLCPKASNPMTAGNWPAAGIRIVDTQDDGINGLAMLNRELLVGCKGGLYSVNADEIVSLKTRDNGIIKNANNGLGMLNWAGFVWYPTASDLIAYRDNTIYTGMGFQSYSQSAYTNANAPIIAMAGDARWLYTATWDGTASTLWRGRFRRAGDGPGPYMVWHCMKTGLGGKVTRILASGIPAPTAGSYLWYAYDGNGKALNVTHSPISIDIEKAASGSFYLPIDDFGFPRANKTLWGANIDGSQFSADETLTINGSNESGSITALAFTSVPSQNTWSTMPVGRQFALQFDLARGSTTTYTPQLYSLALRFLVRPDQDRLYTVRLKCQDNLTVHDNVTIGEDAVDQIANLLALAENTVKVALVDEWGTSYTGVVMSAIPMERIRPTEDEGPGWNVQVVFGIL